MKSGFIGMLLTFCLILPAIVPGGRKVFFNAPSPEAKFASIFIAGITR